MFSCWCIIGHLTLKVKVIVTWVTKCDILGCTLVPTMKSVGGIVFEMWPIVYFSTHSFWVKFDPDLRLRSLSFVLLNASYWVLPWFPSMKSVGEIAS